MAIIKCISSKKSLKAGLDYVLNEVKTKGLVSGINCQPKTALFEMQVTKKLHGKTKGQQFKHIIQSFPKGEVTAEKAHQIGIDFVKKSPQFDGYEVIIATHQDKDHIHNHIIINSVNFENGLKFHQSIKDLYEFRRMSDQLCIENGLSIAQKGKTAKGKEREKITAYNRGTFNIVNDAIDGKADSWTDAIAKKVVTQSKTAKSRKEFIDNLAADGVHVVWNDFRKNIVFEDLERKAQSQKYKIRDSTLAKRYNLELDKVELDCKFENNRKEYEKAEMAKKDEEIKKLQEKLLRNSPTDERKNPTDERKNPDTIHSTPEKPQISQPKQEQQKLAEQKTVTAHEQQPDKWELRKQYHSVTEELKKLEEKKQKLMEDAEKAGKNKHFWQKEEVVINCYLLEHGYKNLMLKIKEQKKQQAELEKQIWGERRQTAELPEQKTEARTKLEEQKKQIEKQIEKQQQQPEQKKVKNKLVPNRNKNRDKDHTLSR